MEFILTERRLWLRSAVGGLGQSLSNGRDKHLNRYRYRPHHRHSNEEYRTRCARGDGAQPFHIPWMHRHFRHHL